MTGSTANPQAARGCSLVLSPRATSPRGTQQQQQQQPPAPQGHQPRDVLPFSSDFAPFLLEFFSGSRGSGGSLTAVPCQPQPSANPPPTGYSLLVSGTFCSNRSPAVSVDGDRFVPFLRERNTPINK
ncbi:unnamed protein product, partial [Ectocarpus sp. 4 AP-2014]